MFNITRSADSRIIKAILHRLADIPGGVTVSVADLGGSVLYEGTPIYVGANGLYNVMKTGKVVTEYTSGTSIEIAKGSHFKVGDKIANEAGTVYAAISAIDKTTSAVKDVVTVVAQFGATLVVGTKLVLCTVVTNASHTGVASTEAAADATTVYVKKGHTLAVGDYIKGATMTGTEITDIGRSNDIHDIITLGSATGAIVAANEALTVVTAGNGTAVKAYTVITNQAGPAVAIVGSNMDVVASETLAVDAWLYAVVTEANGPVVTDSIKAQLNWIKYL